MSLRDKVLTGLGLILTALGIGFALLWSVKSALVVLLLLGLLLCMLLILQRKQMARVQKRLLRLAELAKYVEAEVDATEQRQSILYKRLLGHLQAQQVSIELLHIKLDEVSDIERAQ